MKSNIIPKIPLSVFLTYCASNIINRETLEFFFKENPKNLLFFTKNQLLFGQNLGYFCIFLKIWSYLA